MPPRSLPRVWTREELAGHRRKSLELFVTWFKAQGNSAYKRAYEEAATAVTELLDATDDLLAFGPAAVESGSRSRREAARYLAGPPLSEDDLKAVAGALKLWEASRLHEFTRVIVDTIDPMRFPWLFVTPRRRPTRSTRDLAIKWTAGLIAASRVSTLRRTEPSKRQEKRVDDALAAAKVGFTKVAPRRMSSIRSLDSGQYCRQSKVAGTRADLSIALFDKQRLLALECKVSNSEVNSYKRLNHEVGNKRRVWQQAFGESCITGAVLAGAFSVENLASAQEAGIYLFWEHDLKSLIEFVRKAV